MGVDFLFILLLIALLIALCSLPGLLHIVGYRIYSRKNRDYLHPNEVKRHLEKLRKDAKLFAIFVIVLALIAIIQAL